MSCVVDVPAHSDARVGQDWRRARLAKDGAGQLHQGVCVCREGGEGGREVGAGEVSEEVGRYVRGKGRGTIGAMTPPLHPPTHNTHTHRWV